MEQETEIFFIWKNFLTRILNRYRRKYHLKTALDWITSVKCACYCPSEDTIEINLNFFYPKSNNYTISSKRFNDTFSALLYTLLHEIKHATDYKYYQGIWNRDTKLIKRNLIRYQCDTNYHDSFEIEKRAIKFADGEFKKWGGYYEESH